MIAIDPKAGEDLEGYLLRLIAEARRSRTSVCATWKNVSFVVKGTMNVGQARAAWREAKSA